ncbi:MAG TPA: V-type ATP synthase subunit D [Chloroflexi bacterium]|nr:V-type ATP synthase subunit D [Chloroflexota bacterium]
MARLKLSPTRSNLLMVRQRLKLAKEGFRLLDRKRDVLIMEIMQLISSAEGIQTRVERRFEQAYDSVQFARASMGTEQVRRIALSRTDQVDVQITPRSVMGVVVPDVRYSAPERRLRYGLGDTNVTLDQVQQEWTSVLSMMGELSEAVTTVWRLAVELKRTQRRVNALENVYIPAYEETVAYIEAAMEESEREELFRMKRAKAGREKPGIWEDLD